MIFIACPGGMQVLEGWQIAADHLFITSDDMLLSALLLSSCSSTPGHGKGSEDGLSGGGTQMHHHLTSPTTDLPIHGCSTS